jgi:hypothetical protein
MEIKGHHIKECKFKSFNKNIVENDGVKELISMVSNI